MEPRSDLQQAAGAFLALAGQIAYAALLDRIRRKLNRIGPVWWGGSIGDLLNLSAIGLTLVGLHLYGCPIPISLLFGALITLAVYVSDYLAALRTGRPAPVVMAVAVVVVVPVLATSTWLVPAVEAWLRTIF